MGVRADVLRQLALQYQETKNPRIFEKILKRVDYLILKVVAELKRKDSTLKQVSLEDLYQEGVLSIYDAIASVRPEEEARMVLLRIMAYIRARIRKVYRRFYMKHDFLGDMSGGFTSNGLSDIDAKVEELDFYDFLLGAVEEGLLDRDDMNLIRKRFKEGKTYQIIGEELNIARGTAFYRVKKIIEKIKKELL